MSDGGSSVDRELFESGYLESLSDQEFESRVRKIGELGAQGCRQACDLLHRTLLVERAEARQVALLAAMKTKKCSHLPLAPIAGLLRSRSLLVPGSAALLLAAWGGEAEQILVDSLADARGGSLDLYLFALANGTGPLDVGLFTPYVDHRSLSVRLASIAALVERGDASCTERLVDALAVRSEQTQVAALFALIAVGDARACDAVLRRLELDSTRDRGYFFSFIKLELTFLAQHVREHPEVLAAARRVTVRNWKRRTDPEQKWIARYLPQVSPESPDHLPPPSNEVVEEIRRLALEAARAD
ncbi:HEAT repeat domain-containing protein [Frankia sp. ACN1ag]|uniref:HEAT repeat domain-containing protein n=1 Tax=Frankia sp. ACN1ag TaxID=102891 RepID=UPI000AEA7BB9|nr:HEAT repeat domain-containing protein [Frankia sp. ACN1ag]